MSSEKKFEILPWDTKFFGFPVGRLLLPVLRSSDLPELNAWAAKEKIRCIYFLADPEDAATLEAANAGGFQDVGSRISLSWNLELSPPPLARSFAFRLATTSDSARLEEISHGAFSLTRFSVDTHFSPDKANEMYQIWIRNACESPLEEVLVVEQNGKIAGYVSYGKKGIAYQVGLICVDQKSQRSGLGRALLEEAGRRVKAKGCLRFDIVTQGSNNAALQLYHSLGFKTQSTQLWLHKWFSI